MSDKLKEKKKNYNYQLNLLRIKNNMEKEPLLGDNNSTNYYQTATEGGDEANSGRLLCYKLQINNNITFFKAKWKDFFPLQTNKQKSR